MAILRKLVTYTDYRWEETEELTPCLEDSEWPELIEGE